MCEMRSRGYTRYIGKGPWRVEFECCVRVGLTGRVVQIFWRSTARAMGHWGIKVAYHLRSGVC